MLRVTSIIFAVILAAQIEAYPEDAELLSSNVPRQSNQNEYPDTVRVRTFRNPHEFYRQIFEDEYYPFYPTHAPRFIPPIPFFPIIPPVPIPVVRIPVPDLSSLPDNYDNSTQEVKIIDGKKVVVNQKVHKSTVNDGYVISHFQTYHTEPDEANGNSYSGTPNVQLRDSDLTDREGPKGSPVN